MNDNKYASFYVTDNEQLPTSNVEEGAICLDEAANKVYIKSNNGIYTFSGENQQKHTTRFGEGTTATGNNQFVVGKYNDDNPDALFTVGNGSSASDPHNAFEVLKDGRINLPFSNIIKAQSGVFYAPSNEDVTLKFDFTPVIIFLTSENGIESATTYCYNPETMNNNSWTYTSTMIKDEYLKYIALGFDGQLYYKHPVWNVTIYGLDADKNIVGTHINKQRVSGECSKIKIESRYEDSHTAEYYADINNKSRLNTHDDLLLKVDSTFSGNRSRMILTRDRYSDGSNPEDIIINCGESKYIYLPEDQYDLTYYFFTEGYTE